MVITTHVGLVTDDRLICSAQGNVISTPVPNGTILEGVTRKSIMDIARDLGYQVIVVFLCYFNIGLTSYSGTEKKKVEERCIPIEELVDAEEVFCTGTAVGVAPVGSITYKGNRIEYKMSNEVVSHKLYSRLVGIQRGIIKDNKGWVLKID
ncbi:hypothetical protein DH2020_027201 [Rehmannia glutinosa]|uniref:Uncharacterized protein n=1 Tax=Rehmannia glutinosa TaxID=99300 RepID=A0ABR0VUS1_REHGL